MHSYKYKVVHNTKIKKMMSNDEASQFFMAFLGTVGSVFLCRWAIHERRKTISQIDKIYTDKKATDTILSNLQSLKNKQQESIDVVLLAQTPYVIKPETLNIFKGEQNITYGNDKMYYEKQFGGFFEIGVGGEKITCEINDCVVSRSALNIEVKKKSIFNNSRPNYQSFKAVLNPVISYCLTGTLIYNVQRGKFILDTKFITHEFKDIQDYFNDQTTLKDFLIILSGMIGGLSLYFMYPGMKVCGKKIYEKIRKMLGYAPAEEIDDTDYFNKLRVSADPRDRLKCLNCKTNNSEMVFECGHLVQCQKCFDELQTTGEHMGQVCNLCHKKSNRFTKLFMS